MGWPHTTDTSAELARKEYQDEHPPDDTYLVHSQPTRFLHNQIALETNLPQPTNTTVPSDPSEEAVRATASKVDTKLPG
jgi:hypothetical protein